MRAPGFELVIYARFSCRLGYQIVVYVTLSVLHPIQK